MNFNLSNAGLGSASTRTVKPNWNADLSILEITENNFILSHDLCELLNIKDNAVCTVFFNEGQTFLGNVTGQEGLDSRNALGVTKVKIGEFKNARSARNKKMLDLFIKNLGMGLFTINQDFVKPSDVEFPLLELTPYIVAESTLDTVFVGNNPEEVFNSPVEHNIGEYESVNNGETL